MSNDRHQGSPYPLRMPDELRKAAQKKADQQERSLHWVLLRALEKAFVLEKAA